MSRNELRNLIAQIGTRCRYYVTFCTTTIRDECMRAEMWCDACKDLRHLRYWCRQQNQIGIAYFICNIVTYTVDDTEFLGLFE